MERNIVETLVGTIVLVVAASFVFISYKSGNITSNRDSYIIHAKFHEIGNLSTGSDVRVGGIKVGTVNNQSLDNKSFMAVIDIALNKDIQLPKDSSASIISDGLLGGKYLAIEPGSDEEYLLSGDEIQYTQDAVSFESLIAKFAFGGLDSPNAEKIKEEE